MLADREPFPLAELLAAMTPAWHNHAACIDAPVETFFPERTDKATAPAMCSQCHVVDECLAEGLDVRHGTWGGMRQAHRTKLAKAVRQSPTTDPAEIAVDFNVGPITANKLAGMPKLAPKTVAV